MYRLTNKTKRTVALAKPSGAVILQIGESVELQDAEYREFQEQRISALVDVVYVPVTDRPQPTAPHAPKASVVTITTAGRGKWLVHVNGHEVSNGPVSKANAQRIAAEYK